MKKYFAVIVICVVMLYLTDNVLVYSHESAHVAIYGLFDCDSEFILGFGFLPTKTITIGPCRYTVEVAQAQANVEAIGYHLKALNMTIWMAVMVAFLLFFLKDDYGKYEVEK
ncbi:hypothetical protein LCGC14_0535030 [marine sediment metagenome]|uniref:Uncharacterized protein n=1 Tax=marine sediment metagenome TaxID=412755 RepID=A0A0F9RUI5_9ZZZZ